MVMIRQGGHVGFDAVTNLPPPPSTIQYLQSGLERFTGYLTQGSRQLFDAAYSKIAMFDYGKLQQLAQATGRYLDNLWISNEIQPLYDIGQFQHAPPIMVRWLMAEPTIRQMYHNGEAEGYGENYVDSAPGRIGESHRDWRIVMDGMLVDDDNDGCYSVEYFPETDFEYDVDHDQLSFIDQANIMKSWRRMAHFAEMRDDDPTSPFNGKL